ncbi:hypothetical protein KJM25_004149 [Salmonella enterica]|nr:hypothetical protein [Salmonella enterica]
MKSKENSNRMFGVRVQFFSTEAASQIADALKSEELTYTPVEMLNLHSVVLMFLENADKMGALTLCIAKAVSMLRKQEEVTLSYVKGDGTPVSISCKSPDAVKCVKEMVAELEKNSVQELTIDVAGSPDKLAKD